MYIGALVGGAFGSIAGTVFPEFYSGSSAYALIGTGAVAGAVLGAPMSTILIIFELTGDYTMTIAVMVATVIASIITHQFYGRSYFHFQLKQSGIDIAEAEDRDILHNMRVSDVMQSDFATVAPDFPSPGLTHRIADAPYNILVVVEPSGTLCGLLSYDDIYRPANRDDETLRARDLTALDPVVVAADDLLDLAHDRMSLTGLEHVAVVGDFETKTVIGFLRERDILHAYNRAQEHGYD